MKRIHRYPPIYPPHGTAIAIARMLDVPKSVVSRALNTDGSLDRPSGLGITALVIRRMAEDAIAYGGAEPFPVEYRIPAVEVRSGLKKD